jgi:hypothetical protein
VAVEPDLRERMARRVRSAPRASRTRPRAVAALTALAATLAALVGLGFALARDTLPGHPLYPLKRVQEAAALGLTFDAEHDATRRLSYAARKIEEMAELDERDSEGHRVALEDFTRHATAGAARLTTLATRTDGHGLTTLAAWAEQQSSGLAGHALPTSVEADVTTLLDRIERRASRLAERMGCYEITAARTDDLGVLPATSECTPPNDPAPDVPPEFPAPPPRSSEASPPSPHESGDLPVTDVADVVGEVDEPEAQAGPRPPLQATDVAARPSDPPPPAERPRLPDSTPAPAVVNIPPLLPGLPEVTIG